MKRKRGKKQKSKSKKTEKSAVTFEDRIKKPAAEVNKEKVILLLFLVFVILTLIIMFRSQLPEQKLLGAAVSDLQLEKTKFDAGEKLQGKITLALHPEDILPENSIFLIKILTNASKCPLKYVCPNGLTVQWYVFNATTQSCELFKPDPEGECCLRAGTNCKQAILNKDFNSGFEATRVERWNRFFFPFGAFPPEAVGTEDVAVGVDAEENTIFSSAAYHDSSFQQTETNGTIVLMQNIAGRNFKVSDLSSAIPWCYDNDLGKNPSIRGRCYAGNSTGTYEYNDTCEGGSVKEYYCEDNTCKSEVIGCPAGITCVNGACSSGGGGGGGSDCEDSDGGSNPNVKGTCTELGGRYSYTDFCNNQTLIEYECINGKCEAQMVFCLYGCSDGRCLPSAAEFTSGAITITSRAITGRQWIPSNSLSWAVAWEDTLGEGRNCAFEVVIKSNNNRSLHYYYSLNQICQAPSNNMTDKYIILSAPDPTEDPSYYGGINWKKEERDLYSDWNNAFGSESVEDTLIEVKLISYTKFVGEYFYNQKVWWDYIKLVKPGYYEAKDCLSQGKKCCLEGTGYGTYFGDQLKCDYGECWEYCAESKVLTLKQFIQNSETRNKYNKTSGECQFVRDGTVVSLNDYCYPGYAGSGYTACINTGSNAPANCKNWSNAYEVNLSKLNLRLPSQNGSYTLNVSFIYANTAEEVYEIFSRTMSLAVGEVVGGGGGAGGQENWACDAWSACINGLQYANCTETNTGRQELKNRTCCWSCTEWEPSECPENLTQTRTCVESTTMECLIQNATKPDEVQSCTRTRPCSQDDWQCSAWSKCEEGRRYRTCNKINNCDENDPSSYVPVQEESCRKTIFGGLMIYIIIIIIAAAVAILLFLKFFRKPSTGLPGKTLEVKKAKPEARYPEVVSYIKEALAAGASKKEIETKLLEAGWPKDIIDESFAAAGA
ncbi:MAG: hypothetical protein QXG83_01820 [Candidatus Pacearchaeota archaeon]